MTDAAASNPNAEHLKKLADSLFDGGVQGKVTEVLASVPGADKIQNLLKHGRGALDEAGLGGKVDELTAKVKEGGFVTAIKEKVQAFISSLSGKNAETAEKVNPLVKPTAEDVAKKAGEAFKSIDPDVNVEQAKAAMKKVDFSDKIPEDAKKQVSGLLDSFKAMDGGTKGAAIGGAVALADGLRRGVTKGSDGKRHVFKAVAETAIGAVTLLTAHKAQQNGVSFVDQLKSARGKAPAEGRSA